MNKNYRNFALIFNVILVFDLGIELNNRFRIIILCIILIALGFKASSLKAGVEVYQNQLTNATSDSQRVSLLDKIAMQYIQIDFNKTIEYSNMAIELAQKKNLYPGEMKALINLAEAYLLISKYEEASMLLYSAYYKAETKADSHSLSKINTLIGGILYDLENYDEASTYIKKGLDIYLKNKFYGGIFTSFNYLGNIALKQNNYNEAEKYYKIAISFKDSLKAWYGTTKGYVGLGNTYTAKGNFSEAKICFDSAIAQSYVCDNKFDRSEAYLGLGLMEKKRNNFSKAIDNFVVAVSLIENLHGTTNILAAYYNISDCYYALKDYKNAYEYKVLYEKHHDSIFSASNIARMIRKQVTYDKEKIRLDLEKHKRDLEEKQSKNRSQTSIIYYLIFVILIVLGSIFLLVKSNKKFKNSNSKLSDSLEEIHLITVELEQRKIELEEINHTKDKFFSIIAHDLRNPVSGMMSLTKHLLENLEKVTPELLRSTLGIVEKAAYQSYSLLENLLQWSRSQSDTIEFYPEECELYKVVERNISLIKVSADNKGISFENWVDENSIVIADLNMLGTVIRNFISNSVKFTDEGGKIEIGCNTFIIEGDKYANIFVRDNGVGISEENLDKLFDVGANIKTKGTKDESGSGLGLLLCKEFVEKMGGEIYVKSQVGVGTEFSFYLPVK